MVSKIPPVKEGDIATHLFYIRRDIADIKDNYVTRMEFSPVKKIVFGVVGLILVGVMSGLIALVIRQ